MNKYETYFKQFEDQFNVQLNEDIKTKFKLLQNEKQYIIVQETRSQGKTLLNHLITLYSWYENGTLQKIVKLCTYFYIVKEQVHDKKTFTYYIVSKGTNSIIAEIKYWPHWRKYCFFPYEQTVYDNKCLLEIMNFLNEINLAKYREKEKYKYEV